MQRFFDSGPRCCRIILERTFPATSFPSSPVLSDMYDFATDVVHSTLERRKDTLTQRTATTHNLLTVAHAQ